MNAHRTLLHTFCTASARCCGSRTCCSPPWYAWMPLKFTLLCCLAARFATCSASSAASCGVSTPHLKDHSTFRDELQHVTSWLRLCCRLHNSVRLEEREGEFTPSLQPAAFLCKPGSLTWTVNTTSGHLQHRAAHNAPGNEQASSLVFFHNSLTQNQI